MVATRVQNSKRGEQPSGDADGSPASWPPLPGSQSNMWRDVCLPWMKFPFPTPRISSTGALYCVRAPNVAAAIQFVAPSTVKVLGESLGIVTRTCETLVDGPAASLWYYPESKIVHQKVRRFAPGVELRTILEESLKTFVRYRATKWLLDDRDSGPLTLGDADWVKDWTPRMMDAGWKFWAVVVPKKVSGQMSMRSCVETWAKDTLVVQTFRSAEPALDWLENPAVRWRMLFWHDPAHDVVTMTHQNCVLETPEDATDFMRVVFSHIERHKTPADVLIDYTGLIVKPAAARQFGLERAEFGRRFIKRSYRFNVNTTSSRTVIYTSSVLAGAQTNMYATREDALAALLAQRIKEPLPGDPERPLAHFPSIRGKSNP